MKKNTQNPLCYLLLLGRCCWSSRSVSTEGTSCSGLDLRDFLAVIGLVSAWTNAFSLSCNSHVSPTYLPCSLALFLDSFGLASKVEFSAMNRLQSCSGQGLAHSRAHTHTRAPYPVIKERELLTVPLATLKSQNYYTVTHNPNPCARRRSHCALLRNPLQESGTH